MTQDGEPQGPDKDSEIGLRPSLQPTSFDADADLSGPPSLSNGALLADRFRILRFVARGGMGELYEAEDVELHDRVALKTILPAIAAKPNTLERFLREVHLARRVTHPSVCRTYDLFHHREDGGDIAFVTMEFLEGETLADLLRRKKRLTTEEALPIAQQIAAALSAAHDAGIIHRDLKAGNVLLVPPSEPNGKTRVVVTDFGLAVPSRATLGSGTLTATGHFVGTPSYMAPEQVEEGPITPATDVYSFGILLYEMVTGALPFEGGSPLAVAARRLNTAAPSPRSLLPDLDPVWEAVIERCMKRSPGERFSAASDVAKALTERSLRGVSFRRKRRALVGWLLGAVAAAAFVYAGVLLSKRAPPPVVTTTGGARPSVAVLGFRNLSGRPEVAWLSTAFAEMLTTELGAGGKLRTIPGETVARMKVDLSLPDADSYAHDTLSRVRSNLGTDAVVFGSFLAVESGRERKIRLDLRVQGASAAEAVQVASEEGSESELLGLVARAGEKLRKTLAAGDVSSAELAGTRATLPGSAEAARLYAEGLAKLRAFDPLGARDILAQAVTADPKSALAHSALSSAWSGLGYDKTAAEEARKAFDLSAGLPRESRLQIEGRLHEAEKDWPKAIESHRTLFGFFPDNLEYGLKLAQDQVSASSLPGATETLKLLRALPEPSRNDPRIDYLESRVEGARGEFQRCYDAARVAVEKARAQGARLVAAQALRMVENSLNNLGKPDEAMKAAEEAKEIYTAAGNRAGIATALGMIGYLRYRRGDFDGAEAMFRQALEIDRAIGQQAGVGEQLNYIATSLSDRHDYAGARRAYEEALRIRREVRDQGGIAGSLGNIASLLQYEGDLEGSAKMHDESLTIHRQIGDERGTAIELTNIGIVLGLQGKFDEANRRFDEALTIKRRLGFKSSIAFTLVAQGEMWLYEGRLQDARKSIEEAVRIRQELREEANVEDARLDLAQITVEQGNLEAGAKLATDIAASALREKQPDREGAARMLLAEVLRVKGDLSGARREADKAKAILADSTDVLIRVSLAIVNVRIETVKPVPARAAALRREIDRAVEEAGKGGLIASQLDARIARAELLDAYGDRAAAKAEAREVERWAKEHGFGIAARKAADLLRRLGS